MVGPRRWYPQPSAAVPQQAARRTRDKGPTTTKKTSARCALNAWHGWAVPSNASAGRRGCALASIEPLKLYTIGFTKTSAEHFFTRLQKAKVRRVVDVRLHNVSQLAGFSKKDDLRYFLQAICGSDYVHRPELAPTDEILEIYKANRADWPAYERRFLGLMTSRRVEAAFEPESLDGACLLCSEDTAHRCHRRLVAEYLRTKWGDVDIVHL